MHSADLELVKNPSLEKALENSNYNSFVYKVVFQLIKNKLKKPTAAPNAANFEMLTKSINKLKTMDIKTVYPGHGAPFESSSIFNK